MFQMPSDSFTEDLQSYFGNLEKNSNDIRKNLKRTELINLWSSLTQTADPYSWSISNRTPIIALVDKKERDSASLLFDCLSGNNNDESDIAQSLDYLKKKPKFIQHLNDSPYIDSSFRNELLGKYSSVISDLEEIRSYLVNTGIPAFKWYSNRSIDEEIKVYATRMYNSDGLKSALNKVSEMSDSEVRKYLDELIKESIDVGIAILNRN
jgi:hypothetical protein